MNSERILNILNKLKVYEESQPELENLKKELQADILTNGKVRTGILTTFKKYVRENEKSSRTKFAQIYKTQRGNYCFTDGYFLVDFGNDKENIPAEIRGYINDTDNTSTMDFDTLSDKYADKKAEIDIKLLEKYVKYNKMMSKENETIEIYLPYNINETYINPEFVVDMIKFAGKKIDKITVYYNTAISPVQFIIDNIKFLVLPIKIPDIKKETILAEKENFENLMNK